MVSLWCRLPPPALASHLHAVPLHCPPQGVHSLPTDQDAQVDQQHAPHNHEQLLVFDDLQRERAKGGRHERTAQTGRAMLISLLGFPEHGPTSTNTHIWTCWNLATLI